MASSFLRPITADTTKVTADNSVSRPIAGVVGRLASLFPPAWSSTGVAPIRDALFAGTASSLAWINAFTGYSRLQTRLATATGLWLDFAAYDFFGLRFQRRQGEADTSFSARIRAEIIRPRSTRAALSDVIEDLTGRAPDIFEPFNPGDCGAYGVGTLAYGGRTTIIPTLTGYGSPLGGYGAGAISWGQPTGAGPDGGGAGAYGSLSLPNQVFLTVHRPVALFPNLANCGGYGIGPLAYGGGRDGVPAFAGYDAPIGGFGVGAASYGNPPPPYAHTDGIGFYGTATDAISITDQDILEAVASTAAGGVIAWTAIQGA